MAGDRRHGARPKDSNISKWKQINLAAPKTAEIQNFAISPSLKAQSGTASRAWIASWACPGFSRTISVMPGDLTPESLERTEYRSRRGHLGPGDASQVHAPLCMHRQSRSVVWKTGTVAVERKASIDNFFNICASNLERKKSPKPRDAFCGQQPPTANICCLPCEKPLAK